MVLEIFHHSHNMVRQPTGSFQNGTLNRAESHKLQGNRQAAFESVLRPEQCLDFIVEIDAAGLKLRANDIVDAIGRAVLNLMAQFQQECQIIPGSLFDRAAWILQTLPQFPEFLGSTRVLTMMFCPFCFFVWR